MKRMFFLLPLITLMFFSGCKKEDEKNPIENTSASSASCEGCHTNHAFLKAIATPDTGSAGGGCGGEIPHIEPADRVFLGGSGYAEFKASYHGKMKCTDCHNGIGNTADKALAHSNGFIRHPSQSAEEKCGKCHPNVVAMSKNSLHEQGWGQKAMVTLRYGGTDFNSLPENLKKGYKDNCAKCHGTCGDCHVNRPKAGGGGLYKGHKFFKTPDMTDNCIACHVSRGGHAYLGIAPGTVPDVHLTKAGFTCMNCHSNNEVHGDGTVYNQRYKMKLMPSCNNCHSNVNTSNAYHTAHIATFSCNACHSQDYNNCANCHVAGEGARVSAYQAFKIGMNPIPETRAYKFAVLRRSLMSPDSWAQYGIPTLTNFNAAPGYKYASPHNIQRWTSRTKVAAGKACSDNCHIIKEGTTFRNKSIYLFRSDLEPYEVGATSAITADGKLPASWGLGK